MSADVLTRLATRRPAWLAPVAVGVGAIAVVTTVGVMDPELRGHLSPGCPFRTLTGLDCPGCGGTRALFALTQGDLSLALNHNVLTVIALPLLALAWMGWLAYATGRRPSPVRVAPRTGYLIAAALTLYWVLRNLPWMPFAWLGSTPL